MSRPTDFSKDSSWRYQTSELEEYAKNFHMCLGAVCKKAIVPFVGALEIQNQVPSIKTLKKKIVYLESVYVCASMSFFTGRQVRN